MYHLVTMFNIVMAMISIVCLYKVTQKYDLSHRWNIYVFLTMASMLYLICVCVYNLASPVREWRLSIMSTLWCSKTLYFAYTVRFSAIKKDSSISKYFITIKQKTMFKKDSPIWGLLRSILMGFGSYFIGDNFFGNPITEELWLGVVGIVLSVGVFLASYVSKETTIEGWQGILRQVITFIGGLFVGTGKLSAELVLQISAIIVAAVPPIYVFFSRKKSKGLAEGTISIHQLKQ